MEPPMKPPMKPDDYMDDDERDRDRFSTGALFASGWFRAVLVLGVVAITLVVTVPYVLRWIDPGQAKPDRQAAPPAEPRPAPVAAINTPSSVATPATPPATGVPAPVTPAVPGLQAPAPVAAVTPPTAGTPATDHVVPAPAAPSTGPEVAAPKVAAGRIETGKPEPRVRSERAAAGKVSAHPAGRGGEFWVQVGAFRRERNAGSLVRSIRENLKMPAQMTRLARAEAAPASISRHEVFVSGAPVGAVNAVLRGHGSAQAVRGGVAVQPPLELKEAVALSRRLSGEGLSVKIRRVGGERGVGEESVISYVVRVGGYATRAQAEAARRELAGKGVSGFVTPAATK